MAFSGLGGNETLVEAGGYPNLGEPSR